MVNSVNMVNSRVSITCLSIVGRLMDNHDRESGGSGSSWPRDLIGVLLTDPIWTNRLRNP